MNFNELFGRYSIEEVLNMMPDGVVVVDASGIIVRTNTAAEKMFGYAWRELLGKPVEQLIEPARNERHKKMRNTYMSKPRHRSMGRGAYLKGHRKDGSFFYADIALTPLRKGHSTFIMAIVRDVSKSMASMQRLKEQKSLFKNFSDAAPGMFITLNKALQITFLNPSVLHITGFMKRELMGKHIRHLFPELKTKHFEESLLNVWHTGENLCIDEINIRTNEQDIHLSLEAFRIRNGVGIIATDITRLKHAVYELSNFMYRISHDMKAPADSILGLLNVAEMETEDPSCDKYFDMIKGRAELLREIVSELSFISSIDGRKTKVTAVDFRHMTEECLSLLTEEEGFDEVRIEKDIRLNGPFESDRGLLLLIMKNLLENALKYRTGKNPFIKITAQRKGSLLEFSVEDNGIGIPETKKKEIFDLFQKAHETDSGAGIGLYAIKKAVMKLNGTIDAESMSGKGSRFTIAIPATPSHT